MTAPRQCAARELAQLLHTAQRSSAVLLRRIEQTAGPTADAVVPAARRCHALLEDALLIDALDLAVRLGMSDDELPR